jgi:hypothetical protein
LQKIPCIFPLAFLLDSRISLFEEEKNLKMHKRKATLLY